ncbi:MAG: indole-3-glycerol phosphate synthase TrpC [Dehalococcoidia bacterium]|nr:indole-3-glycerol phosphate synthase TrpC [Dehalococcoidia bacterium]
MTSTNSDPTRETGTVLDRIVAQRREQLTLDRAAVPQAVLETRIVSMPPVIDFAARLREGATKSPAGARLRLVAEIKRASPSKGVFDASLDAGGQARRYAEAGAAAVSVLTEPAFFQGSLADIEAARAAFGDDSGRPALLRKDFLFDAYQVIEARVAGADALLLITMMLQPSALAELLALTHATGLEALVEVHDEAELRTALDAGARVVGVNNRDLRTFAEDLATFERLGALVPAGITLVAESAIKTAADARRMAEAGAHAVLVGEALVLSGDIEAKARELTLAPTEAPSGGTR